MVCDAKFQFTSVCASWPGSIHDSRIWRESGQCLQFQRGIYTFLLFIVVINVDEILIL